MRFNHISNYTNILRSDFMSNVETIYIRFKMVDIIGAGDWSHYIIKTETLHFYPVYVRVESDIRWGGQTKPESWNTWYLDYVEIEVNPEKENITYCALDANDTERYIKLGLFDGRFLYLVQAPKQARIARKKIKVKKNSRKEKRS